MDPEDQSVVQQCIANGFSTSENDLLNCVTTSLSKTDEHLVQALDFLFLLYSTSLVFFMQAGFAMLCAGSIRLKNVQNTMLKNLLDACGAAIGFWTFGYAFAYSSDDGKTSFIGSSNFLLVGVDVEEYSFWLFQFAFAATSATIVAGTLAERCQMIAYLCYSMVLTGFVYPVIVRAVWSEYGFLNRANGILFGVNSNLGMIDFAGSGVVHVTGGATALLATSFLGPRKGRFYDLHGNKLEEPKPFPGHSAALQVLGTFILWFGWYGFNCGSIINISTGKNALISSLTALNTTLSASGGCIAALFTKLYRVERRTGEATFNLVVALNGTLSGLVAITAGCAVVDPWASLLIGIVSGWVYLLTSHALVKRCIDDAVDAIPVHLANGVWGCFAVGLFATPEHIENLYGNDLNAGCFYEFFRGSGNFSLLAAQIIGVAFIIIWVFTIMSPFFWVLNYLGWFRADSLEEVVGLDLSYHGYSASTVPETIHEEYFEAYRNRKLSKRKSYHGESHYSDRSSRSTSHHSFADDFHGANSNIVTHEPQTTKIQHPVLSILKKEQSKNENLDETANSNDIELQEEVAIILGNGNVDIPKAILVNKKSSI